MRRVLHGDITAAARVLLGMPGGARVAFCQRLIKEADYAHRFMKRIGRVHPLWGDGSLMSAALKYTALPEPSFGDDVYCECLRTVLEELLKWRVDRRLIHLRN